MFRTKLGKTPRYELYEVLDLSKDASVEDIKKAYKKSALRHHPDKGGDAAKFRGVVNAFNILNDPRKKSLYDESEERKYRTNIRKERTIKKDIREETRLDKKNIRAETRLDKKDTREEGPLDKDLLNHFACHFGATASMRPDHEDVYKRTKIVEDAEIVKGCKRIIFQHFAKASR